MDESTAYATALLGLIADDRDVITYRPRLRTICGSVTAVILMQQVIYRWKVAGFKPFYKFNEPCDHPLYREGDSWEEELGLSYAELHSARKRIAKKLNAATPDDERLQHPIVFWTDADRVTWYDINPAPLAEKLAEAYTDNHIALAIAGSPVTVEPTLAGAALPIEADFLWQPSGSGMVMNIYHHFRSETGLFPKNEQDWLQNWLPQIEAIIGVTETLPEARKAISAAIDERVAGGNRVFTPATVYKTAVNIAQRQKRKQAQPASADASLLGVV